MKCYGCIFLRQNLSEALLGTHELFGNQNYHFVIFVTQKNPNTSFGDSTIFSLFLHNRVSKKSKCSKVALNNYQCSCTSMYMLAKAENVSGRAKFGIFSMKAGRVTFCKIFTPILPKRRFFRNELMGIR